MNDITWIDFILKEIPCRKELLKLSFICYEIYIKCRNKICRAMLEKVKETEMEQHKINKGVYKSVLFICLTVRNYDKMAFEDLVWILLFFYKELRIK